MTPEELLCLMFGDCDIARQAEPDRAAPVVDGKDPRRGQRGHHPAEDPEDPRGHHQDPQDAQAHLQRPAPVRASRHPEKHVPALQENDQGTD